MWSLLNRRDASMSTGYALKRERQESGFSLVEVMVVILIAGILLGIAIPVWMGQQKTQADDRTRVDASSAANALKEVVIQNPTSPSLRYKTNPNPKTATIWADLNNNGTLDTNEPSRQINRHPDTKVAVRTVAPGKFEVYAWNPDGRHYTSAGNAVLWSSVTGGFEDGIHSTSVAPS